MIKKYALEIAFIFVGSILFFGCLFGETHPLNSRSKYFLNAPNHFINSKRDFSVGKISHITKTNANASIPLVQITVDKDDFFGFENGIYTLGENWHDNQTKLNAAWWKQNANYKQRGFNWEKKCKVNLDENSFNSKVKINGNNTRAYAQKSLRFKIDKSTQKEFWKRETSGWLILRNSGNDWDRTLFADAFISKVISELNVYTPQSKLVRVFLNNYDWGFYNARERMDEDFFASRNDSRAKDVFLIENNGNVQNGGKEAEEDFNKLTKAIKSNDVSKLKKMIDEDNFIDYIIVETFFNNIDWPSNNVLVYKIDGKKSKWQFVPKDLDFCMAYSSESAYKNNMFVFLKKKNTWMSKLFYLMLNDLGFKQKYKERVSYLLENELSNSNLLSLFKSFEEEYAKVMPFQILRWRYPRTIDRWSDNVKGNKMFLENRSQYYKNHVAQL